MINIFFYLGRQTRFFPLNLGFGGTAGPFSGLFNGQVSMQQGLQGLANLVASIALPFFSGSFGASGAFNGSGTNPSGSANANFSGSFLNNNGNGGFSFSFGGPPNQGKVYF